MTMTDDYRMPRTRPQTTYSEAVIAESIAQVHLYGATLATLITEGRNTAAILAELHMVEFHLGNVTRMRQANYRVQKDKLDRQMGRGMITQDEYESELVLLLAQGKAL